MEDIFHKRISEHNNNHNSTTTCNQHRLLNMPTNIQKTNTSKSNINFSPRVITSPKCNEYTSPRVTTPSSPMHNNISLTNTKFAHQESVTPKNNLIIQQKLKQLQQKLQHKTVSIHLLYNYPTRNKVKL